MDGWLAFDKPLGWSCTKLGAYLKKRLGCSKIGHIGTLDPLATGVLVLAMGEATKFIPYLAKDFKQYAFTISWGEQRSTDDGEGEIIQTSSVRPDYNQIISIIPKFLGFIEQTPPIFSAVHVQGVRAYKLARAGQAVEIQKRTVRIDEFLLNQCDQNSASFTVRCGGGTYIRSLARDIAHSLGTLGYVSKLRRTQDGSFCEGGTISIENFDKIGHKSNITQFLRPIGVVLDDIPAISVSDQECSDLMFGRTISRSFDFDGTVSIWLGDKFIGIGTIETNFLKPKRLISMERKNDVDYFGKKTTTY